MSSSLQEAVDAAHLASQDISPSSSKGTGATGSTEAPGCATASLIGTIAARHPTEALFVGGVEKRASTRGTSSHAFQSVRSSRTSSSKTSSGYGANRDLVVSGALLESPSEVASDASWSQISSTPAAQPAPVDAAVPESTPLEETDEVSTTSFAEQYLSVTDSQEEEGLVKSVTRSQSDFSNWLADTMAHARGDGTSTVDSEEAFNAVADATRQARMGFTYSQAGSECGLGSPFSSDKGRKHASHIRSQPSSTASFVHRSGLMSQLDQLLDEEKTMSEEKMVEVKMEEVEEPLEAQELPPTVEVNENTTVEVNENTIPTAAAPQQPTTDHRWQLVSAVLGASLLASLLKPHLSFLRNLLQSAKAVEVEQAMVEYLVDNATHATSVVFDTPLILGPPIPLGTPLSFATIFGTLLVLATIPLGLRAYKTSTTLPPPRRTRSSSPLLEMDPTSVLCARDLIVEGMESYGARHLSLAETHFSTAAQSRCAPLDKAIACEWLGRTRYRLARTQDLREAMERAGAAFARSVRLDGSRATARASLGRAMFHLQDFAGAVRPLEAAIKRDPELAYAHEYLGKTFARLGRWELSEIHLRKATSLDPTSYTSFAFLGEQLHARGRTDEARIELEEAIKLRCDYPAAHARLAFIATEQLDNPRACAHLRRVIACRETGCVDDCLPTTTEAIHGPAPFLSLYFATPSTDVVSRTLVLRQATKMYPHETILTLLLAINLRRSNARDDRHAGMSTLRSMEETLEGRVARYGDEVEAQGLLALALVGLGKGKQADGVYEGFWRRLGDERGVVAKSGLAFLVMAFYELKRTK